MNANSHGQKVPKENTTCKCISSIMLDSVIRVNKKYHPQTLLEQCIYAIKKNKVENLISHDLTSSSSDDSDNASDDSDNKSNDTDNKSNNESVNEYINECDK